jgi:uncharacterized ferritin-like protein (DUF455 family)
MTCTLADLIFQEAQSQSGTWSYSFNQYLNQRLSKLKKRDAEKLVHELIKKILENKDELLTFKLCQICSVLNAKKLDVFKGIFEKYSEEIEKFILEEKSLHFREAIDGLLSHLLS